MLNILFLVNRCIFLYKYDFFCKKLFVKLLSSNRKLFSNVFAEMHYFCIKQLKLGLKLRLRDRGFNAKVFAAQSAMNILTSWSMSHRNIQLAFVCFLT